MAKYVYCTVKIPLEMEADAACRHSRTLMQRNFHRELRQHLIMGSPRSRHIATTAREVAFLRSNNYRVRQQRFSQVGKRFHNSWSFSQTVKHFTNTFLKIPSTDSVEAAARQHSLPKDIVLHGGQFLE